MTENPDLILEWARVFRSALKGKYGRIVSAATIARDLQLWSGGHFHVSNETVRKWLIGRNMPRYQALVALEGFLGVPLLVSRAVPPPPPHNPKIQFRNPYKHEDRL